MSHLHTLLRFIWRSRQHRVSLIMLSATCLCFGPMAEVYGYGSIAAGIFCWSFGPIVLLVFMAFCNDWMRRTHIKALEDGWYYANHNSVFMMDESMTRVFMRLRREPWDQ